MQSRSRRTIVTPMQVLHNHCPWTWISRFRKPWQASERLPSAQKPQPVCLQRSAVRRGLSFIVADMPKVLVAEIARLWGFFGRPRRCRRIRSCLEAPLVRRRDETIGTCLAGMDFIVPGKETAVEGHRECRYESSRYKYRDSRYKCRRRCVILLFSQAFV